ncbi:MAG: sulfatase-like hydrolase/transferase [Proteobacteria bacterium]|nr:sulfatase-like hydrolase/transferase [Pseudomonadota bacterium]
MVLNIAIKLFFLYLVFSGSAHCAEKPNIVFIFADDQSWPHANAYGDVSVKTPSFDKIAEKGVLFNHAFVGAPSCSPSRAVVLTGRNHWELESASNLFGVFPDSLLTYTRLLLENGYQLGNSGKGYKPGRSDVTWADSPVGNGGGDFPSFFKSRDKKNHLPTGWAAATPTVLMRKVQVSKQELILPK